MLAPQPREQVEDAGLDEDVERRGRLVEDDQLRPGGQRPRDGDALAFAAREAARRSPGEGRVEVDLREQRGDPAVAFAAPADAVDVERQPDAGADAPPRVERRQRVLLDELDGAAKRLGAARRQDARRRSASVPAVGAKRPRMMLPSVVLPEPDSPTMAWQPPRSTSSDTSSSATHRVAAGAKRLAEPIDLENGAHAALAPGSPQPGWTTSGNSKSGLRSGIRGRPPPRMFGTAASRARV